MTTPLCRLCNKTESDIWHHRNATRGGKGHKFEPQTLLTVAQADELVLAASTHANGAIEDCSVLPDKVLYFFETGEVGSVSLTTGAVEIKSAEEAEGRL